MVWRNDFSLADIISIVMVVATFITIILVLIQRHDFSRPYITLRSKKPWYKKDISEMLLDESYIDVVCMGSGFAKEIRISCSSLIPKPSKDYKNLRIIGDCLFSESESFCGMVRVKENPICFDAINNSESFDISSNISGIIHMFCIFSFEIFKNRDKNLSNNNNSYIVFNIQYKDSIGKTFTKFILMTFNISVVFVNEKSIVFSLTCKTISKKEFKKLMSSKDLFHI